MAARRAGNPMKYQVTKALEKIKYFGVSKKELRDKGKDTGLHSHEQMKHALSYSQNFVQWLKKEKGIKDLYKLKRADYREYIDHMKNKGVSYGHIMGVETNLRLLNKGMNQISKEKGMKERDWVPKQRLIDSSSREEPSDRSYTDGQLKDFYNKMSPNVRIGADLQMAFGLRLREVANTRVAHIVNRDGKLYWKSVSDKKALNTSHGVTKAGRPRETPCRIEYQDRIRELIKDKRNEDFIVPVKYNTLKSGYNRSGMDKGSHGFRHTYAREMLRYELQSKGIEKKGLDMVRQIVTNHKNKVRKDTGILKIDKPLYRQVNKSIDTVHAFLGHGKGRTDLCVVYMQ